MRIAIVCHDTRGGIQPYLGLGIGLKSAGYDVVIVAPKGYLRFVESTGLACRGLAGDVQAYMNSPEVAEAMERGFWATHKLSMSKFSEMACETARDCLKACADADIIIGGFGGMIIGESVAEKLGVPFVQAHLQPLATTAEYPGILSLKWLRGLGIANRLSHAVTKEVFWQLSRSAVNTARREVLGLPPSRFWSNAGVIRKPGEIIMYGYSPSLLPRPKDWQTGQHITGYWFLDDDAGWSPPEDLTKFIEAGPPPIAIGFGSMISRDAEATTRLALKAAEASGQRVVLIAGWGGLSKADLPDSAYLIESIPHSWLFPRCSLAVHHGGAGTTGAALRAGIPSVIVPFGADQPFWGWLLSSKHLGTNAGARKHLTHTKLAQAISTTLSNKSILERTSEIGRKIREEDGVGEAILLLDQIKKRLNPVAAKKP